MRVLSFLFFWLGASVGSFISVLAWRNKLKVSIGGRSFCDHCGRKLLWWENIPIVSFLILRGRCRTCHSPIPYWYPLMEAGVGLAFVLTYWTNWTDRTDWVLLLIVAGLLFVLLFDALTYTIPDKAIFFLFFLTYWTNRTDWTDWTNWASAAAAASFLFLLHLMTKGKGMGLGDVKFAFFMGFFLGFPKIVFALYLAFVLGAFFGIFLILFQKAKLGQKIPFGPFLVLGTLFSLWWGGQTWEKVAFLLGVD